MFVNDKGLSLIEILIAIGLMLVVVAALTKLAVTTLNTSDASRIRSVAQEYADAGIDFVRFYRDTNSAEFFALGNGDYQKNPSGDGLEPSQCSIDSGTMKEGCEIQGVVINNATVHLYQVFRISGDATRKEVTVYVLWNNGSSASGYSKVETGTILTKWRN